MSKKLLNYMVSYARGDKKLVSDLLDKLNTHLMLSRNYKYERWIDDDIYSYNKKGYTKQIVDAMEKSNFVLLCGSPLYFTRNYIKNNELPIISRKENKKLAILVTLKPLDFKNYDLLGFEKFNFFNLNGKAYSECRGQKRDDFAYELFLEIERIMKKRGY